MGWGCPAPPFQIALSNGSMPRGTWVLVDMSDNLPDAADGPPGIYELRGRVASERLTLDAWNIRRGKQREEGSSPDRFRVIEVTDWCVYMDTVPRAYIDDPGLHGPWTNRRCSGRAPIRPTSSEDELDSVHAPARQ